MRLEEISNFEEFTLKGTNARVKVRPWTQEALAAGKLHVVWIRVKGLPDSMKNYHALCEVGSNVGVVLDIDMEAVRVKDVIRVKIGMLNTFALPLSLVLTTPNMLLYNVTYELHEVVEVGWLQGKDKGKGVLENNDTVYLGSYEILSTKKRNWGNVDYGKGGKGSKSSLDPLFFENHDTNLSEKMMIMLF
ncbi:hypothetical protein GUJ93_ZPchr0004g38892 [Zizania palustris]|uniref:DUF4283 domain-containing protein n=1 Tax=Zizania palustris TaxID=103762 RepID=A0A8J5V9D9_ZIZPA|nr:hypothetical protein GUJ93_ZPchr0004g38892 [Zizania palustris]